jgi:hypothetical protein
LADPSPVDPEEFAAADVVVSIGSDLVGLPQPRGRLVRWDEVPPVSDGFTAADEAIRKRVIDLVDETRAFDEEAPLDLPKRIQKKRIHSNSSSEQTPEPHRRNATQTFVLALFIVSDDMASRRPPVGVTLPFLFKTCSRLQMR